MRTAIRYSFVLVLAMSLIIFDGVYKQRAKGTNHVV